MMIGVENREEGVESREKSRQEEEGNGDGAVKDEDQERNTVNPDSVVGGHAGEMNQPAIRININSCCKLVSNEVIQYLKERWGRVHCRDDFVDRLAKSN
ncbi:Hypothetical predicted protein [Octopus vulgaris]|uniref:Uncharacterized protein n=1 Tax=Octopus vulgaris TaxID=6645 RepID=A0AA36BRA0_OCTVU|nr:Hypothetical predicted protein [Octopus vulgaris]